MENAQNKPVQPRNIFEGINQNVVYLSQDLVQLYEMNQKTAAKVEAIAEKIDAIYAALYQPMPEQPATEIPESSPNDPGEGEGSENE